MRNIGQPIQADATGSQCRLKCFLTSLTVVFLQHYMTETMALPTNFSVFMSSLRTQQQQQQQQQQLWEPPEDQMSMDGQQQQPHAQQPQHPNSSVTCSGDNCKDMSMDVRCQMACCAKQCCLPVGINNLFTNKIPTNQFSALF